MHRALTLVTIIGFSLGVAVMLGLKMLTQAPDQNALEGQEPKRQPRSLILTLAVDFTRDGLPIGVGFAAGAKQGVLFTIALALEAFFLGFLVLLVIDACLTKLWRPGPSCSRTTGHASSGGSESSVQHAASCHLTLR